MGFPCSPQIIQANAEIKSHIWVVPSYFNRNEREEQGIQPGHVENVTQVK